MTLAWVSSLYGKAVSDHIAVNLEYQQWEKGAEYDPFAELWELTSPTNTTTPPHEH
jgi:hypothetical protein